MIKKIITRSALIAAFVCPGLSLASDLEGFQGDWWINAGIGGGSSLNINGNEDEFDPTGLSLEASFNYMVQDQQLFTFRTLSTDSFSNYLQDLGPLYGYIYKTKNGYASASAGLAYTRVHREDDFITQLVEAASGDNSIGKPDETVTTVGVPLEVQGFVTPTQAVGFGAVAFANLNDKASVAGINLSLQAGVLN